MYQISQFVPQRSLPYEFTQIIGPSSKTMTKNTQGEHNSRTNTVLIGERGLAQLCDSKKIARIRQLSYSGFIHAVQIHDPLVRTPCPDEKLASSLGFNYFHYLQDPEKASQSYMIAALHPHAPSITISMPAIIQSKLGDHMTSTYLRYERYTQLTSQAEATGLNLSTQTQLYAQINRSLQKAIDEYLSSLQEKVSNTTTLPSLVALEIQKCQTKKESI